MKYAIITALTTASLAMAADCPSSINIEAFSDKKCKKKNESKSKELNENWSFLTQIYNKECFLIGDRYMQWSCPYGEVKAQIFTDSACRKPEKVAREHPLEKVFKWGKCVEFGSVHVKLTQQ